MSEHSTRPVPSGAHGHNGYTNYGCRCDDCREAMRAAGPRRLRKRGPNAAGGVLAALRPPGGWGSYTDGES